MADPIIEQILQEVEARIAEITTVNGFNQDLNPVRLIRGDNDELSGLGNGDVVLLMLDVTPNEELSSHGNVGLMAWDMTVALAAFVVASDSSTTAIDTLINQVRADIEKKLMADPQRGDLAIDTIPAGASPWTDPAGRTGIDVYMIVQFRTSLDDPYTGG